MTTCSAGTGCPRSASVQAQLPASSPSLAWTREGRRQPIHPVPGIRSRDPSSPRPALCLQACRGAGDHHSSISAVRSEPQEPPGGSPSASHPAKGKAYRKQAFQRLGRGQQQGVLCCRGELAPRDASSEQINLRQRRGGGLLRIPFSAPLRNLYRHRFPVCPHDIWRARLSVYQSVGLLPPHRWKTWACEWEKPGGLWGED